MRLTLGFADDGSSRFEHGCPKCGKVIGWEPSLCFACGAGRRLDGATRDRRGAPVLARPLGRPMLRRVAVR